MQQLKLLETKLSNVFKDLPPLPASAKKMLSDWWPWLALLAGVFQLLAAWGLYDWGRKVNKLADSLDRFTSAFGVAQPVEKLNIFYWISLVVLVATAVLFLMAYPALKAKKKSGWDLMFLAALLNAVYGVFSAANSRGGLGSLVGSLLGTAIGLYFLFQVRDLYTDSSSKPTHSGPKSPVS